MLQYIVQELHNKSIDCENYTTCRPVVNASYRQTIYHHLFMDIEDKFSTTILFTNLLTLQIKFSDKMLQKDKTHCTVTLLELEKTSTDFF